MFVFLTINGRSISAQPPPGYYNGAEGLTGGELKAALHQRIRNHTVVPYFNLLDPLRLLYEDPSDPHNILLTYSLTSVSKSSSTWNREHLWPRARGNTDALGPDDSDLFHVVPTDTQVNNQRGHLYFDDSNTADPGYQIPAHPFAQQTSRDSDSWQPAPSERGDIARALFYMEVRYDGSEPNTTDMELVSYPPTGAQMANLNTLLLWHEQDPPDDAERRRNELIFNNYQHNRNPFIDRPEWVAAIWGIGTSNGSGTQPIAQVTGLSASAVENPNTPANVQVALNQFASTGGVTVAFDTSGTATTADYNIIGQGVTFDPTTQTGTCFIPANFYSVVLSVVPVADGLDEPTETVTITILPGKGYTVVPDTSATVIISDGPALPAFWNFDSGTYPDPLPASSGFGSISFAAWQGTITTFAGTSGNALALVGTSGNNSSIDFRFSMERFTGLRISFYTRGSSTGFDTGRWSYSVDGTNFTELPGVNTATRNTTFLFRQVDFSTIALLDGAPNVTLRYTLSGATGSAGNNRIDDFTINATPASTGDQLRTVQIAASDATASENGDEGVFTFRINGIANPGGLLVGFELAGTATPPGLAGADYNLDGAASFNPATRRGTILIPEGANAVLLRVLPIADGVVEGTETARLTLESRPDDYLVGANHTAIINITEPAVNDHFANAIVLPSSGGSFVGNNTDATSQSGEPNHAGFTPARSVWWSWTAPADGSVTISTAGSNFDTLLGIYTGTAVQALTTVAYDTNSSGLLTSAARFSTVAGVTYHIAVDAWSFATGNINLSVTPSASPPVRPSNDNFAQALFLSGNSTSTSASSDFATREPGEPTHGSTFPGKSIWWRWTAVNSGPTTLSTAGSNFDTLLAVYTGSSVDTLSLLASNNDFGSSLTSRLTFTATAGVTYCIAVDGHFASSGTAVLAVTGNHLPPPNDSFANAIELSGTAPSTNATNLGATKEPGEPNHGGSSGGKSVWWRWTAPASGTRTLTTAGSNYDTTLGVYTGGAVNALTLIAGDDDSGPGTTSRVIFNAVAGTTYQIAVDGWGAASGSITLAFSAPATPPSNDHFADAIVLTGHAPSTTGRNTGATKEPGEPNHAGDIGGHSVWWRWTATKDGYASISTGGSNFDTLLAVYTGSAPNALTLVAENDQANLTNQSQVVFATTAGVMYHIAVDGWRGEQGNISLAINGPLPLPRAWVQTADATAAERPLDSGSFFVTLSDPQPHAVLATVTLGGTATPGLDYTLDVPRTGHAATVSFAPGQTVLPVTVTPIPDQEFTEFDETILPAIATGSGYQATPTTVTPIILRDDTPYSAAWAQQFGPSFTGPAAAPLADFNSNGVANLLEFAFNGNPVATGPLEAGGIPLLPVIGFGDYPDPNSGNSMRRFPTITFNRRTDAPQLTYVVQHAEALEGNQWTGAAAVFVSVTTAGMPPGVERVTFRSAYPATGAMSLTPQFLRVVVIAP